MTLTPAELVVLGLVVEEPRHGYDVERTITARGIRQWADVAFSSIYYILGKLESRGLLQSEHCGGPKSRRVYAATDAGRSTAAETTAHLLGTASPSYSPFVVGLANVDLIDDAQLRSLVRARIAALTEQVSLIEVTRASQSELPRPAQLVFSYTLARLVAERDWLTTLEPGEAQP